MYLLLLWERSHRSDRVIGVGRYLFAYVQDERQHAMAQ